MKSRRHYSCRAMFIFFIYQKNFVSYTWILIKIILRNDRVDRLMPTLPELNLWKLQISILWFRSPHIQIWGVQSNFFYRPNVLRWSSIQMKICSRLKKLALHSSSSRFKFKNESEKSLKKSSWKKTASLCILPRLLSLKVYVIKSNCLRCARFLKYASARTLA